MAEGGQAERALRDKSSNKDVPEYEVTERNTAVFHVGAFGRLWRSCLPAREISLQRGGDDELDVAAVAEEFGCALDTAAELKLLCSTDSLKCFEEDDVDPNIIPEDTELVTLGIRKKVLERRKETIIVDRPCRQETFTYELESQALGKKPQNQSDLVEEGELVLTLNVFYPVIFQKDLYKSAFFHLEGTFYNDMRYPECRELSRTTIDWSESLDRGYGKFQKAKMEDYTFNDLRIKIGFPYLYCHQGDCEHIVMITDIRFIHCDDCLDRNLYPLLVKKHWLWTRKCCVCKMYTARWVTNDDSLAPDDPCFFCDVCFKMLHYDAEGNKLGDFLAYPYVDPGIFN
ncbi:snRNA-activating protein complex subunit 3 isoform X3 [Rhinatrema bivittatum]|uniref:snRNA-activating protein complex subunit 3 isoform X3 n=1 Tax=Rhinatrema bivittatum TaxID=194408 RepID=UPI00112D38D2|nr:snRNA-activating protein complex subunit 3 isoform X3 [Rhinatrema bivittatum]